MKVEFFRHNVSAADIRNVNKALRSIFLTTGKTVADFEDLFADYVQARYAVGLSSCTAALQLALNALDIGQGCEVITTPMSFVATANAIIQAGAKPVFVDVEKSTGNINADLIARAITKNTKAIMPVHLYGQMCDMKKIKKIADRHNLKIIEDAAHCVEGERDGIRPGELADAACFSFYATKSITCGEGGAVTTNNRELAEKLKKMRMHGLTKTAAERYDKKFLHWDMEIFGWKYNMDNIQASLLINQLENIDKYREKRENIYKFYRDALGGIKELTLLDVLPRVKHACHLFTFLVDATRRDEISGRLSAEGVPTNINYRPIHLNKYYRKRYGYKTGDFPVAEYIGSRTLTLPLYPKLEKKEVVYIVNKIKKILTARV